jgi:hypothetical protein
VVATTGSLKVQELFALEGIREWHFLSSLDIELIQLFLRACSTQWVDMVSEHELLPLKQTYDTLKVDLDGGVNDIFDKPSSHLTSLSDYATSWGPHTGICAISSALHYPGRRGVGLDALARHLTCPNSNLPDCLAHLCYYCGRNPP